MALAVLVLVLFTISIHTWKMSARTGWIGAILGAIATWLLAILLTVLAYMAGVR